MDGSPELRLNRSTSRHCRGGVPELAADSTVEGDAARPLQSEGLIALRPIDCDALRTGKVVLAMNEEAVAPTAEVGSAWPARYDAAAVRPTVFTEPSSLGANRVPVETRSEERRVGRECVSTGRDRWPPYH